MIELHFHDYKFALEIAENGYVDRNNEIIRIRV